MTEADRFKAMIEELRPVAARSAERQMSPLAKLMARERDSAFSRFVRSLYVEGGFDAVAHGLEEGLNSGVSPVAVVEAAEAALAFHEECERQREREQLSNDGKVTDE